MRWPLFDGDWLHYRGKKLLHVIAREWKTGLMAGALSAGSYSVAMWAMTRAPIASVAALRETSIVFAMIISVFVIGERMTAWRITAAACSGWSHRAPAGLALAGRQGRE